MSTDWVTMPGVLMTGARQCLILAAMPPQTFAERLFGRLNRGTERFETRLRIIAVVSRAIGVHKLLLLNFYPFLQKYIQPHQRDVTDVLAALIQVRCRPRLSLTRRPTLTLTLICCQLRCLRLAFNLNQHPTSLNCCSLTLLLVIVLQL